MSTNDERYIAIVFEAHDSPDGCKGCWFYGTHADGESDFCMGTRLAYACTDNTQFRPVREIESRHGRIVSDEEI